MNEQVLHLTFPIVLAFFGQYVWPLLLGAGWYLYRQGRRNERLLVEFQLYVAREYNSKTDLKRMLDDLRGHVDTRFNDLQSQLGTRKD